MRRVVSCCCSRGFDPAIQCPRWQATYTRMGLLGWGKGLGWSDPCRLPQKMSQVVPQQLQLACLQSELLLCAIFLHVGWSLGPFRFLGIGVSNCCTCNCCCCS